jgi:hypothetical protein
MNADIRRLSAEEIQVLTEIRDELRQTREEIEEMKARRINKTEN